VHRPRLLLRVLRTAAAVLAAATAPARADLLVCTPRTLDRGDGVERPEANPIARALELARAGDLVLLEPGVYEPFTIGFDDRAPSNARTAGGTEGLPIVVEGKGSVRIRSRGGDTIAIDQRVPNGWITFRNLVIEAGSRAGVMFYRQGDGRVHAGFAFEDCRILGNWNPVTRTGQRSKWGVWGHSLADFRFVGVSERAEVSYIGTEHGFYLQNPRGDVTIAQVDANFLGRTFFQLTSRAVDGPPGVGTVTVRDCHVLDVGVAREDGFKGGAAFTVAGRHRGRVVFERNTYRAGFWEPARALTLPGQAYGTGAFVAWQGGEAEPNAEVVLRDNVFEFATGCGDRPVVALGGCGRVVIEGANRFTSGGSQPALALDPVRDDGRPVGPPVREVVLDPRTILEGGATRAGRRLEPADLAALAPGPPAPPAPPEDRR